MTDELLRGIAVEHGTPTYVYDLATVTAKHAALTSAFPDADIRYAVKANALGAILRHAVKLGMGAEALTEGELERVLRAGFAPERIVLSGGAAPELAPHLPMPVTLNDNLVLDGLVLILRAA